MAKYKEVTNSSTSSTGVVQGVRISGEQRGDIIKFYNEVYIPLMKSFLLRLGRANVKNTMVAAWDSIGSGSTYQQYTDGTSAPIPVVQYLPLPQQCVHTQRVENSNVFISKTLTQAPKTVFVNADKKLPPPSPQHKA